MSQAQIANWLLIELTDARPVSPPLLIQDALGVIRAPRIYLYHAYLAYMEAYGHQRSLSLTKFGKDFPKVMKEFGAEYKKARTDKGFRYNMDLSDTAKDWLPALALPHHPQPEDPPY